MIYDDLVVIKVKISLLVSDDNAVGIHTVLLRNVNTFLYTLLQENYHGDDQFLILPSTRLETMKSFVTLIYTGSTRGLTKRDYEDLSKLTNILNIETSIENENVNVIYRRESETLPVNNNNNRQLKLTTKVVKNSKSLCLSFPRSRSNRDFELNYQIDDQDFTDFEKRIAHEYNKHAVGKHMGPYDQNSILSLKIQLPNSSLDYQKYTEFFHTGNDCFEFVMEDYENLDVMDKIHSYKVKDIIRKDDDSDNKKAMEDDEHIGQDQKFYSCQFGLCRIPCPCPQCFLDSTQCQKHKMKHVSLFDENTNAVSIRSTEDFCVNKNFFKKSYILKYSGIPTTCTKCMEDLQIHHCYHFDYHEKCRFCKPSWFKYKAKTLKEFNSLMKEEFNYFNRVCPHCNKQFISPTHAKKHIDYEHKGKKHKCSLCDKMFNSKKAKEYHEQLKHSMDRSSLHCDVCQKQFTSEVTLKSHVKYVHSLNKDKFTCLHCDKVFSLLKNLRCHLLYVHGINQMTESYGESENNPHFECEKCGASFQYRKSLKFHMKSKHNKEPTKHTCNICEAKFAQKSSLSRHIKMKH